MHNDDDIMAECVTFLLAGSQTVTSGAHNALYYAAANQDLQDKIFQEVDAIIK
jgi:cytochrome P450